MAMSKGLKIGLGVGVGLIALCGCCGIGGILLTVVGGGNQATPSFDTPPAMPAEEPMAEAPEPEPAPEPEAEPAEGTPLQPSPISVMVGGQELGAQVCSMQGMEFLGDSTMRLLQAVEVVGDRLLVVGPEGKIHAFTIGGGDACELTLDTSFGEGGTLGLDNEVKYLSRDASGRVSASHGIFEAYLLRDGAVETTCKTGGFLEMHDSGTWAIGPWVNSTVKLVAFEGGSCSVGEWVLKNLSKAEEREGIFQNVNSSTVMGDTILIGGILAEEVNPEEPRVVVAYDRAGTEQFRFGNTEQSSADDGFGWIHAIQPCRTGICVLDANYRRMTLWSATGEFVGVVKLSDLFDLKYPWIADFTVGDSGAYFVAAQDREGGEVAEGLVYRVSGL